MAHTTIRMHSSSELEHLLQGVVQNADVVIDEDSFVGGAALAHDAHEGEVATHTDDDWSVGG